MKINRKMLLNELICKFRAGFETKLFLKKYFVENMVWFERNVVQTPSTEEGQTEKSTLNTRVLFLALRFADVTNDPLTLESFSVSHSTTLQQCPEVSSHLTMWPSKKKVNTRRYRRMKQLYCNAFCFIFGRKETAEILHSDLFSK